MRAVIVSTLFLVLFATGFCLAAMPRSIRCCAWRPTAQHSEAVGDIVLPMPDGKFCRHMSFDNTTAEMIGGALSSLARTDIVRRPVSRYRSRLHVGRAVNPGRVGREASTDALAAISSNPRARRLHQRGSKIPPASETVLSPPLDQQLARRRTGATSKACYKSYRRRLEPPSSPCANGFSNQFSTLGGNAHADRAFYLFAGAVGRLSLYGLQRANAQASPDAQQACTPDAMRLCSEFIPDVAKITACMKAKHSQLSSPASPRWRRRKHEGKREVRHVVRT